MQYCSRVDTWSFMTLSHCSLSDSISEKCRSHLASKLSNRLRISSNACLLFESMSPRNPWTCKVWVYVVARTPWRGCQEPTSQKPSVNNSNEGLGERRGSVELLGSVSGSFLRGRRVNLCLTSLSSLVCFPLILENWLHRLQAHSGPIHLGFVNWQRFFLLNRGVSMGQADGCGVAVTAKFF